MSYSIDPNRESKTKRYSNLSNSYGTIKFQKKKANMQQIMQSIEGGTDLDFNILELLDKKEVSILKRSHLGLPLLDPKSASLGIKFSSKPGFQTVINKPTENIINYNIPTEISPRFEENLVNGPLNENSCENTKVDQNFDLEPEPNNSQNLYASSI